MDEDEYKRLDAKLDSMTKTINQQIQKLGSAVDAHSEKLRELVVTETVSTANLAEAKNLGLRTALHLLAYVFLQTLGASGQDRVEIAARLAAAARHRAEEAMANSLPTTLPDEFGPEAAKILTEFASVVEAAGQSGPKLS